MHKDLLRCWFYINLIFIINYTLGIMRLLTVIPIICLPNFFNILALISSYIITLIDLIKSPSTLVSHANFICIWLFLTLPNFVLLFPFFLLSVYHTNGFIIANKRIYQKSLFFNLSLYINEYTLVIGKLTMYCEVMSLPLSAIMYFTGHSSLKTIVLYLAIIVQQYMNNQMMKAVVNDMLKIVDGVFSYLPAGVNSFYLKFRSRMQNGESLRAKKNN